MTSRTSQGMTLVELALTAALVGMIALISWPSVRGVSRRLAAKSAAQDVLTQLRSARERAVLSGQAQSASLQNKTVIFSPDGSATFARADFETESGRGYEVEVRETGGITLREK